MANDPNHTTCRLDKAAHGRLQTLAQAGGTALVDLIRTLSWADTAALLRCTKLRAEAEARGEQ